MQPHDSPSQTHLPLVCEAPPTPLDPPLPGAACPPLVVVGREIGRQLRVLNALPEWHEMSTVADAAALINDARPPALFIDASDDPGATRKLCAELPYRPAIAFVSNNPLFAHDAYELGAVDCVAKPIEPARLAIACERLRARYIPTRDDRNSTEGAAQDMVASRWLRMVRNGSLLVTPLDQVVYFQAERKLTRVVLEHTDGFLHMGINAVAAKLDSQLFWRLHRSTIVNGRFVSIVQRDDLGRLSVKVHGRPEVLYVSKSHDALWRDGIF